MSKPKALDQWSLKNAVAKQLQKQQDQNQTDTTSSSSSSSSASSINHTHNVSNMYYDADFKLGEDAHSNEQQESKWSGRYDGRQHLSHREQAKLRAGEFKEAIMQYHIIQFFLKEITYDINNVDEKKSTYFTLLNFETIRIIVDYAYPGQGVLLTSQLMLYEPIHDDNEDKPPYTNVPFRLCARKRPLQEFEIIENAFDCIDTKNNTVIIHEGRLARNGRQLSMRHVQYSVDRVWNETVDNDQLCIEEIDPLVNDIFDGKNATIICFGQTGTGKTYTLMGALQHISSRFVGLSIAITFFEIHGKKCYDLLNHRKQLQVLSDDKEDVHIKGIYLYLCFITIYELFNNILINFSTYMLIQLL